MSIETNEVLAERLQKASLCALPQSAAKLIQLSKDPMNGPREHAIPISADMGLSAQVLRFVNSSFFGFSYKIKSIPMAISLASVRTIRNFVLWSGLFAMMPNPKCGPFSLKVLFQDSLRRAVFARQIGVMLGNCDPEELFLCAILQDMSVPILGKIWNKEYTEMIIECNNDTERLSHLERGRMGWDHAEAGAILIKQWNLDEEIAPIVAAHTSNNFSQVHTIDDKKKVVTALSSLLPSVASSYWREAEQFLHGYNSIFHGQTPDLEKLFQIVDFESAQLVQLVSLGEEPKSLVQSHREYVESIRFPNLATPGHSPTVSFTDSM